MRNYVEFDGAIIAYDDASMNPQKAYVIEGNLFWTGEFNPSLDIDQVVQLTIAYFQSVGATNFSSATFTMYVLLNKENVLWMLGFGPGPDALQFFDGTFAFASWDRFDERFMADESPRGDERRRFRLVPIRRRS